jgi:hypothetical protein
MDSSIIIRIVAACLAVVVIGVLIYRRKHKTA